jgi:hypothetical protein
MPPKKVVSIPSEESSTSSKVESKKSSSAASTSTVKVNSSDSDRLQLAQAINNLVCRGESFVLALEGLSNFSKERIIDLDLKIEAKKQEYQDLNLNLENQFKDNEIKLKQNLQENKLLAVKEVLDTLNMRYVTNVEFEGLTKELTELKSKYNSDIQKVIKDEQEKAGVNLKQVLTTKELSHSAEIASLKAQTEQQVKEIAVLKETIKNLKEEIMEQRILTKEVAIAGSKSQIQQSFGKS